MMKKENHSLRVLQIQRLAEDLQTRRLLPPQENGIIERPMDEGVMPDVLNKIIEISHNFGFKSRTESR